MIYRKPKKNALLGSVLSFISIYNQYFKSVLKLNQQILHFEIIHIFRMTIVDKTNRSNVFGPSFTNKDIG
jgi:hypothetical protein